MKIVRIVCGVLFCGVIVFGIVSRIVLGFQYPAAEIVNYGVGDAVSIDGFDIIIEDVEIFLNDELERRYPDFTMLHNNAEERNTNIVFLHMRVINRTNETLKAPPVYYATISAKLRSTACNMSLFRRIYDSDLSFLSEPLEPNGEMEIILTYDVSGVNWGAEEGLIPLENLNIIYSLYPKTMIVNLKEK